MFSWQQSWAGAARGAWQCLEQGTGQELLASSSQPSRNKLLDRSGTGFPILMVGLFPHGGSVPWIHRCL